VCVWSPIFLAVFIFEVNTKSMDLSNALYEAEKALLTGKLIGHGALVTATNYMIRLGASMSPE
jgi:hypothetical protein